MPRGPLIRLPSMTRPLWRPEVAETPAPSGASRTKLMIWTPCPMSVVMALPPPGGARPSQAALLRPVHVQPGSGRVHHVDRVMPLAVVVPGQAERATAPVIDVVGVVPQVPRAEVPVVEEQVVAVVGAGDVLAHDSPDPGGGAGLEPGGDAEGIGVETGGMGHVHAIVDSVEGQALA